MPLLLYAFRYKHPRTGKWVKARYRAELHDIQRQYPEYELLGEPEVREPNPGAFNPYRATGEQ